MKLFTSRFQLDIDRWNHPPGDEATVDERARFYRRNSLNDLPIRSQEPAKPVAVDKKKVRTLVPGEEQGKEEDEGESKQSQNCGGRTGRLEARTDRDRTAIGQSG